MTWHVDPELLERYALGVIDEPRAYSVEAHLLACDSCREHLGGSVPRDLLDRVWNGVAAGLDAPRPGVVERLLVWFGLPDHVARLLAATRSLRLSWFVAMAVALGFAVVAARGSGQGVLLFLTLAPLVPVAGVAAAYGPGIDPTYEVGLAAPIRSHRLLFIRSIAVVASSTLLAGASALALPGLDWRTAAWLLPSLGLCAASLALSTVWRPLWATGSVALAWMLAVTVSENVSAVRLAAFRASGQLAFLLILLASVGVLAGRRAVFDTRRPA